MIADGTFTPGTTLPSELELRDALGVSRETIRMALGELEKSGEVVRRQDRRRQVAGASAATDRRYEQVAAAIRDDVRAGAFPPGTLLPGEDQLSDRYRASRPTVSAALALLEQAAEIERTESGRRRIKVVG